MYLKPHKTGINIATKNFVTLSDINTNIFEWRYVEIIRHWQLNEKKGFGFTLFKSYVIISEEKGSSMFSVTVTEFQFTQLLCVM